MVDLKLGTKNKKFKRLKIDEIFIKIKNKIIRLYKIKNLFNLIIN